MGCIPCHRNLISVSTINHKPQDEVTKEIENKIILREQMTKFKSFRTTGNLNLVKDGINFRHFRQKENDNTIKHIYLIDKNSHKSSKNLNNDISEKLSNFRKLNHVNITQVHDIDFTIKKIQIKCQMTSEDNIIDKVIKCSDLLAEYEVKKIMKNILEAIHYYHSNNVIDCDLSHEKILIDYNNTLSLKLVNFGIFNLLNECNMTKNKVRSIPFFLAPEVLQGNPTAKSDLWSCGVIMYMLFYGDYPFNINTLEEFTHTVTNLKEIRFYNEIKSISLNAKELMRLLLNTNPDERVTAEDALKHEWFTTKVKPSITSSGCLVLREDILDNIKKHHSRHKLLTTIAGYVNHKCTLIRSKSELENIFIQCKDRIGLDDLVFCVERVMSPIETKLLVDKAYNKLDITDDGLESETFLKYAFDYDTMTLMKHFESYVKIHFGLNRITKANLVALLTTGLIYDKYVVENDLFELLLEELNLSELKDYSSADLLNLLNNYIKSICSN
jgi:serine/threonine protein kinase